MANLKGAFTVTVHGAKDLKNTATFGKQDPFCKLTIGSQSQKTKVHQDGGTQPIWNQSFTFNLEGKEDLLHIACAEDGSLSDTDISRADLHLKTLLEHAGRKYYPMVDRNNFKVNAGYIELTCEFKGTGAPTVLSKSAEVLAQEKLAAAQQTGAQQLEIEKMRLEVEKMRLEAQAEQARAAQAAALAQAQIRAAQLQQQQLQQQQQQQPQVVVQPVYVQPTQQPVQQVQPTPVQQVQVKTEVKSDSKSGFPTFAASSTAPPLNTTVTPNPSDEKGWRICDKCQSVWCGNRSSPNLCAAGGTHTADANIHLGTRHSGTPTDGKHSTDWKMCKNCAVFFWSKGKGKCPAGKYHDDDRSAMYHSMMEPWNRNQGDKDKQRGKFYWCNNCSALVDGQNLQKSVCPVYHNAPHDITGSPEYFLSTHPPGGDIGKHTSKLGSQNERDWRWCGKCQCLYRHAAGTGVCIAGGAHNDQSNKYAIHFAGIPDVVKVQSDWRWCVKCMCLWNRTANGPCHAGGQHNEGGSAAYHVSLGPWNNDKGQGNWRWCNKCACLTFGGGQGKSKCPGGGTHNVDSQEYWLAIP